MDCVVFRARSGFARFRKPYTTTSALTFLCIHPVAIKGLVGAVMGIDKAELHNLTSNMKIGVQVISYVRKDMQALKLLSMKSGDKFLNFPANVEFLRNPEYRIFISWDGDKLDEFESRLINQNPIFTPYFGTSENIAKLVYETRDNAQLVDKTDRIDSIIPSKFIDLKYGDYQIFMDRIPVLNNEQREYVQYEKIVFGFKEGKCCSLVGSVNNVYEINEKYVYFF
ncbi:type I-B CRISPR-associated protein Cas5b [Methanolobus bombayensis]|uniref:type I-B CRISPR-associated protein Cas5b n=1 Tax=Methanolobus bombayensis TaxID=38023 RepID=UPI001AE902AE|nr:type I-B CRISPR-associated protein Cas5b [Methanolobus bombayensis]MBP1908270.1 CRISPR-associated protein Cas5h [Methanolobus bombayensis]